MRRQHRLLSGRLPGVAAQDGIVKRLYSATVNSLRGLIYAVRSEAALREEAALLVIALPLGWFVAPAIGWYVAMIGVLLALLAIELLNTAIEKLADHITR